MSTASVDQREILRDGIVSYAEYERAALAMANCVGEAGIRFLKPPRANALGQYAFTVIYQPDQRESGPAAYEECDRKFWREINQAWVHYRAPNEDQVLQSARDDLAHCLRPGGADIPEHPSAADFQEFKQQPTLAFLECLQTVQQSHNLEGWAP
jgi:hypothetical protein